MTEPTPRHPAAILGLARAVPPHHASREQSAAFAIRTATLSGDPARLAEALHARTGIRARASALLHSTTDHPAPLDQHFFEPAISPLDRGPTTAARMHAFAALAAPLAAEAATGALHSAARHLPGLSPDAITHLITVSCTGLAAPGLDIDLIDALALSPSIHRVNIGFMGCHGGVIALRTAAALAAADPAFRILVICAELCSLHFQYSSRPDHIVANALFADGAAAAVVAQHASPTLALTAAASRLFPNTRDAMSWSISDHGFEMTLAESVPDIIRAGLAPWLFPWLAAHGITSPTAARWAIHPGGPKVLTAVAESLSLPPEALEPSRSILRDHGNMSSPTVLFILDLLARHTPAARAADPIVLLGFGPGLTAEAALLTMPT